MATHSSVLAWRIPGTAEPGGLPAVYGVAQSWTRLKRLSSSSSMGLKEKRVSEDEMTGWHQRCNGHELGQTCEGQAWHAAVQNGAEKSWTRLGD